MSAVLTDELQRIDQACAGNRLLSTFPNDARALLEPLAEVVDLELNDVIHDIGADVSSSYFPYGTAMVSLVIDLAGGR